MRRERSEDGGVVWRERWNAFECLGCCEFEEIRKRGDRTPAKLAELRELLVADHTECWEFDDPKMARDARRYRSEKKRRELLSPQRHGPVAGGPDLKNRAASALDRQAVSWRGRNA